MATIAVSCSLSQSDTAVSASFSDSTITMSNARKSEATKSIPTTAAGTAIGLVDVTTPRWAFFKNLEASGGNFVEIGVQTGGTFYPLVRLNAGWGVVLPLTAAPYARADTGAVKLLYAVLDA